jgi:hypothetical protein
MVLQDCGCCVEGETGCCSETCVTFDVDGTEDGSIDVEEAIDTKDEIPEAISFPPIKIEETIDPSDEIPEAISFPPIKTEQEVRFWVVCEVVADHAFRPFIASKRKLKLHLGVSCFVSYCGYHVPFEIWVAIMKRRDL